MNKLNKELLARALVEGVKSDEHFTEEGLVLSFYERLGNFHFVHAEYVGGWVNVCTKEEYLAAKAEKESRKTVMDVINRFKGGEVFSLRNICYDTSTGDYCAVSNTSDLEAFQYFVCNNKRLARTIEACQTNFGTSLTRDEYKKGYKLMQDTVSEYDIGCYYEFSDYEDFNCIRALRLGEVFNNSSHPYISHHGDAYRYIRPLTIKAGEIRKPKPLSGFINANDDDSFSFVYSTRKHADDSADNNRVACIDLSQHNVGEGL